jgi:hypothetical protein
MYCQKLQKSVTGVEKLNDETLVAIENGITVAWLVPKIVPDIEPEQMFTSTVALPSTVRRLTKVSEVKVGVNDWPKGEKTRAYFKTGYRVVILQWLFLSI